MKHFISIVAVLSLLVATAAIAAPADLDENAPTILTDAELVSVEGTGKGGCWGTVLAIGVGLKFFGAATANPVALVAGVAAPLVGAAICK
ncbi:MAG: hypothetical protein F4210_04470 [Holophagales bacterium]|nr:hypothetical protein [Holophagales bacterium]MYF94759.1 hypothetical protein [Holophagales bacterium]